MPQRWRRLHPLLGGLAHTCTEPVEVAVATTTGKMNGRYPQHLSHQHNHLTSAAIYAAHGRNPHHNLQDERPLPAPPLSTTQAPHFVRALTSHELRRTAVPPTQLAG
jgi:hypothetical protein